MTVSQTVVTTVNSIEDIPAILLRSRARELLARLPDHLLGVVVDALATVAAEKPTRPGGCARRPRVIKMRPDL